MVMMHGSRPALFYLPEVAGAGYERGEGCRVDAGAKRRYLASAVTSASSAERSPKAHQGDRAPATNGNEVKKLIEIAAAGYKAGF